MYFIFLHLQSKIQEEEFELIATSLKNAKAVISTCFSDDRNQHFLSIIYKLNIKRYAIFIYI